MPSAQIQKNAMQEFDEHSQSRAIGSFQMIGTGLGICLPIVVVTNMIASLGKHRKYIYEPMRTSRITYPSTSLKLSAKFRGLLTMCSESPKEQQKKLTITSPLSRKNIVSILLQALKIKMQCILVATPFLGRH